MTTPANNATVERLMKSIYEYGPARADGSEPSCDKYDALRTQIAAMVEALERISKEGPKPKGERGDAVFWDNADDTFYNGEEWGRSDAGEIARTALSALTANQTTTPEDGK